jgi:hypothetical protein
MNDIMTLPGAKAVRTSFVLDNVQAAAPLNAARNPGGSRTSA